jgi:hypothetical protein
MQTIETRYVGQSSTRGSKILATASGNKTRVSVSYDSGSSDDHAHALAVKALCDKLGWEGKFVAGHTKRGMVWVFDEGISPRLEVGPARCDVCGKRGPDHGHYDATDASTHKFVSA